MNSDHNPNNPDHNRPDDFPTDRGFDEQARAAGRELREPAPAEGLGRLQAAKRRRNALQVGAAMAVGVFAVGGIYAFTRSDDKAQTAESPPTGSSMPDQAGITTPSLASTPPSVTTQPVVAGSDTTSAPAATVSPTEPVATQPDVTGGYEPNPSLDRMGGYAWFTDPITDPPADGLYFSHEYRPANGGIVFALTQEYYSGYCGDNPPPDCEGNDTDPVVEVTLLPGGASTSLLWNPSGDQPISYVVTVDEFISVLSGQAPAGDAPEGFIPDPVDGYTIQISGGNIVAVHQASLS